MTQTVSRPQQSWIGQTIGGRYKIEALLGHGGMSTVYQASDPNLRRTVAVKLIHPHLSNDLQFVRRFEQEAAAVAQLRHPNIIQVFDFAHDEGVYYMVLEYVPGETLQARLTALNAAHQRMPLSEVIQTMASICDAVAYAHQRNMIHRDLKPANVMLSPQGQPILMDFGVAKMLGEVQHTATGAVVGTALYMSPEQARGERPDERSDIYSLGVMLYEMITGVPPFKADSAVSLMMKHVTQPVPDIRQVNQTAPDLLVAVTKKALAKEPGERYRTASDMAVALRAIDTSGRATVTLPVKSPTDSTVYEPVAPISAVIPPHKNNLPLILGGIAAVLLLLVVVGAALFFLFRPGPSAGEEQVIAGPEDATLPSSEKMIKIGAGTYSIGRDAPGQNYAPPQEVKLSEFWIDQYEVSNAQYAQFLADTQNQPPATWPDGKVPADQADFPVQGVSWDMANAYCQWAKKRLPAEVEWEVAARGPEGRLFPWGNDPRAVELPRSGVYKVGGKPTNQSAFGVFDMAGNVWEWVGETYGPVQKEGNRILRGGENGLLKDMAYRLEGPPNQESIIKTAGIRCAADKVEVPQPEVAQVEGVLVQDNFADPGSGWPILSEGSYLYGYHPPDYYHVEVGQPEARTVVARAQDFEDVTVEAKVLVDHTDTEKGNFRYGLALRRNGDSYYAFTVSPRTGTWQVLKSSPDKLDVLAEGGVQTLQGFAPQGFTPDKTDALRVDASGPKFTFQINGQTVSEVNDSEYVEGEVGFYVETFDETLAHIHYDELTILEVKGDAASPLPVEGGIFVEETFTDPNTGWPVVSDDKYVLGYHPPDYYHVQVGVPNDWVVVSKAPDFENATIETEVLVDHTDTDAGNYRYGLALRRSGEDQFYAFVVSSRTGTWQALKHTTAGLETLAEGKIETLQGFAPVGFTPDKSDLLRVDAQGSDFVFRVNGQPLVQVTDGDYKSGEVGFYVETFDESLAHVHYESLTVRKVEFEAIAAVPAETEPVEASTSDVVVTPTTTLPSPTPSPEPTIEPTATSEPPTPTATTEPATPTVAPSPTVSTPAGMVLIPAGSFLMGSSAGQPNEAPEHEVSLSAFYLDIFEVSNAHYRACVEGGGCTPGNKVDSFTYKGYRDDPAYNDYPVMGVTWDQAGAYCRWAGKRLPTEAEWEYAASGPQNFTWPWGNTFDAQLSAASAGDTQPVDSYPAGVSPFGVYNMAGNVGEWVADVYDETFYANSPVNNPISTGDGAGRIFRGGSFANPDGAFFTTSRRYGNARAFNDVDVGFRCAQDAS
ncbi:MAG: bifunctional serine/threonine-protein kinase/formylglycine-generating enzyme family protein [Anaerolineae bacterium]|nr:bifunctional serine/threonine-protein kinase/formylglycine-generating enzyme family protein [Anaerolineae bacterium]